MHALGLTRDPFAAGEDPSLHWESRRRMALRKSVVEVLCQGRSVWIDGPEGAGREAFARCVARYVEEEGLPLAQVDTLPADGVALLALLHRRLCPGTPPTDLLALAEGVYAALLDGCWRGGPVVALTAPGAASRSGEELALLHGLRFLERAVSPLLLVGEGEPPFPDMLRVTLAPFTREECASLIRHRLLACGNSAALDDDAWAERLDEPLRIGQALALAADALARRAYHAAQPVPVPADTTPEGPPLFPSETLAEVGDLLRALSQK